VAGERLARRVGGGEVKDVAVENRGAGEIKGGYCVRGRSAIDEFPREAPLEEEVPRSGRSTKKGRPGKGVDREWVFYRGGRKPSDMVRGAIEIGGQVNVINC